MSTRFAWFRDVLAPIPTHSVRKLEELLPHAWAKTTPAHFAPLLRLPHLLKHPEISPTMDIDQLSNNSAYKVSPVSYWAAA